MLRKVICGAAGTVIALGLITAAAMAEPRLTSTPRAHAHNDYEHESPLFDALSHGFISVEADIWPYDGDIDSDGDGILRVSHNPVKNPTKLQTLRELYLDPLRDQAATVNNGGIYADGATLLLLVDIKTDGEAPYSRLHELLSQYAATSPDLFTSYSKNSDGSYAVHKGAVDVVVSGNRPREPYGKSGCALRSL